MKMYAIKMIGTMKSSGNATNFKGISGFDVERCALKCNKAEREFLLKAGYDIEADTEEFGSKWLSEREVNDVRKKIEKLECNSKKENEIQENFLKFIETCNRQDYLIRIY